MLEQIQPENINNKMCSAVTGAIYLLANKMKSVTELRVSINRKSLSFSLVGLLVLSLLSGCANPSGTSNPQMATAEAVIAHYDENVQQFQNSGESERLLTEIVEHNPYIAETSALVNFMPAENGLGGGFCSGGMFNINGINYVLTATHCMSQRITDTLKLSRPHLSDKLDIPAVIEAQRDFPDRDLTIMRVNTSGVSFPAYVAPSETVDPRNISTEVTGIVFPGGQVNPAEGHATNLTAEEDDLLNTANLTYPLKLGVSSLSDGASGGVLHSPNCSLYMSVAVINPQNGYQGVLLTSIPNLNEPGILP